MINNKQAIKKGLALEVDLTLLVQHFGVTLEVVVLSRGKVALDQVVLKTSSKNLNHFFQWEKNKRKEDLREEKQGEKILMYLYCLEFKYINIGKCRNRLFRSCNWMLEDYLIC